jgi:hypothetical protein
MPGLFLSSVDHHFIAVDGVGKVWADGFFGDTTDFQVKGLFDLVLNSHQLEEAFWAGDPYQDIDITFCSGFSPGIRAKDGNSLCIVLSQYCNDGLTDLLFLILRPVIYRTSPGILTFNIIPRSSSVF